jgi:spermidine synthase
MAAAGLGLTAFASGFIILSLEVLGFRVLAPHFGYSVYVFGSLVGLILVSLAAGYWLGGYCSRRGMLPSRCFMLLLAAAIYLLASSLLYRPVLRALELYGAIEGSIASTAVLWAFPMVALAAVSPYLVGIWPGNALPGQAAGWVSALGTLGSVVGTFAASFCLLPSFGTRLTFVGNAWAALGVSVGWLAVSRKKWPTLTVLAFVLGHSIPPPERGPGVLYTEESAYTHLEVVDFGNLIGLRTDRRSGIVYSFKAKRGGPAPVLLYRLFAVPVLASRANKALVLGFGTGTLAAVHEALNPEVRVVGVEIDPRILALGRRYFGLDGVGNIDSVVVADARPFLRGDARVYDVIEIDIFRSSEIPFYLVTREFFTEARAHLTSAGVLAMNVFDATTGRPIAASVARTLGTVFEEVQVVRVEESSFLLVASRTPLALPALSRVADRRLAEVLSYYAANMDRFTGSDAGVVFTDDDAPIELLYREWGAPLR